MRSEGPTEPVGDPADSGGTRTDGGIVRTGLLISAAVGIVGVTFGVLADAAGLSLAQASAMSLFVFTGASQFAAVSVAATGGGVIAILGASVLLSARNTLYGPVVAQWFDQPVWKRLGIAQLIIDESTGVGATGADRAESRLGFIVTGVGVFVAWNIGTVIGVLSGDLIGDPARFGLDVAFPASFLALLAPHLKNPSGRVTAGVAALIVVASVSFVPVGAPILLAALAIIPGLAILRREPGVVSEHGAVGDDGAVAATDGDEP